MSKSCAGTGKPLAPGTICYSVLIEKGGLQERLDFSEEGWQGIPKDAVGFWKCEVPVPTARQVATTDAETLMKYFEQLVEGQNTQQQKLAYVLALYLLQRRRLKLDGSREEDGIEFLELSGVRGEGPFEVRDQQLSDEEMKSLREALDHQLTAGGDDE
ncbi:hypothetical protein SH668x_003387 [Planctomicrobium sp. SH668]|uniref:hypothetical protein n=1 Tax=Planctomicrobium sp. SH668 TaxID=3448126 RepID=UPI003F5C38EA